MVGHPPEQSPDAVERVPGAAAMAGLLALDAASHLVDGDES
jgi:hypothetical protein